MNNKIYVSDVASELHDEWRASRKLEEGGFEPRIKPTKDQSWIDKNGTDQVDIANIGYENLPEDWQKENKDSAESAVNLVSDYLEKTDKVSSSSLSVFIEEASAKIHDEWLERNSWAKWWELDVSFSELSEDEKNKDRNILRRAANIMIMVDKNKNKINWILSSHLLFMSNDKLISETWSLEDAIRNETNPLWIERLTNLAGDYHREVKVRNLK